MYRYTTSEPTQPQTIPRSITLAMGDRLQRLPVIVAEVTPVEPRTKRSLAPMVNLAIVMLTTLTLSVLAISSSVGLH